jgi:hypothetical protein
MQVYETQQKIIGNLQLILQLKLTVALFFSFFIIFVL